MKTSAISVLQAFFGVVTKVLRINVNSAWRFFLGGASTAIMGKTNPSKWLKKVKNAFRSPSKERTDGKDDTVSLSRNLKLLSFHFLDFLGY